MDIWGDLETVNTGVYGHFGTSGLGLVTGLGLCGRTENISVSAALH